MEWSDLSDTPENRSVYLKSRHILDWPVECMEAMRLSALGYSVPAISRQLGIDGLNVHVWLDYAAGRICVTWPELLPERPLAATWLGLHERCCVRQWQVEVDDEAGRDPLPDDLASPEVRRTLPRWRRWFHHDLDDDTPTLPPPSQRAPDRRRRPGRR
jgi:hypothetical protein